jgi:hypothetical protein
MANYESERCRRRGKIRQVMKNQRSDSIRRRSRDMRVIIALGGNPTIQNSRSPTKSRRGTQKARTSALPADPNRRLLRGCRMNTTKFGPVAIVKLGGATSWNVQGGAAAFGPDFAVEITPIENRLELEAKTNGCRLHPASVLACFGQEFREADGSSAVRVPNSWPSSSRAARRQEKKPGTRSPASETEKTPRPKSRSSNQQIRIPNNSRRPVEDTSSRRSFEWLSRPFRSCPKRKGMNCWTTSTT